MIKSNNKGITLIALVITIIVLLIIASITITGTITGVDESRDQKLEAELKMVQHAVLERYTKYSLTKEDNLLIGKTGPEIPPQVDGITWQYSGNTDLKSEKYYEISSSDFPKLGITDIEDTYIVNYKTGEAYNKTSKKSSGEILYIYSVDKSSVENK